MVINKYNFIRWDDGEAEPAFPAPLSYGYVRDNNRCDYKPLLVPGEAMSFYINKPNGFDHAKIAHAFRLDLYNIVTGTLHEDVSALQVHSYITGSGVIKSIYSEVVIDVSVPDGDYQLKIYDLDEDTNWLTSNTIQVVSPDHELVGKTMYISYRHDRTFYFIPWHLITTFYQAYRLHVNVIDEQYEVDFEVYNEVTTGKQRTFNANEKKLCTVDTYYFDRQANEAAAVMFRCSKIYLNGNLFVPKPGYKIGTDQKSKIAKGQAELYDQEFASVNHCGGAGCIGISIGEFFLPDGQVGIAYSFAIDLEGTAPFALSPTGFTAPSWMTVEISGTQVLLTGTPDVDGTDITVAFTVTNCSTVGTADFSDQIDIASSNIVLQNLTPDGSGITITRFFVDGTNIYVGAAIAAGEQVDITIPNILDAHEFGVRVLGTVPLMNFKIIRGGSVFHSETFTTPGDIFFTVPITALAGDEFSIEYD